MPVEPDAELEQAARQAFARMIGAIEVTIPERRPASESAGHTADVDGDQESDPTHLPLARPQDHARLVRRAPRRRGTVLVAGVVAAAAAAVLAVVIVPERSSPGRTTMESPPTQPTTTTAAGPPTSEIPPPTTRVPPTDTSTSSSMPTTTQPPASTGGARPAERLGPLDPATSGVPLDGLVDVVQVQATNGPVTLQAATHGDVVAMQLVAPWLTGFGPGVEGTRRELQAYWMVSTVDAQHVVWGLAPDEVERVVVYTTDGQAIAADTVPVGPPGLASGGFAVLLPELASIEGLAGERRDGGVVLAGREVEASLAQVSQHGPHLREWTAFVPVARH